MPCSNNQLTCTLTLPTPRSLPPFPLSLSFSPSRIHLSLPVSLLLQSLPPLTLAFFLSPCSHSLYPSALSINKSIRAGISPLNRDTKSQVTNSGDVISKVSPLRTKHVFHRKSKILSPWQRRQTTTAKYLWEKWLCKSWTSQTDEKKQMYGWCLRRVQIITPSSM